MSTKELPSYLGEVQRRLKRGYAIERTRGGHFRLRNPRGELVQYQGKNLTLTGTGRSDAQSRMETALKSARVLKAETKPRRTRHSDAGIQAMQAANRQAVLERRAKTRTLKAEMEPWMKTIGASTPGVVWDLARYLHETADGVFLNPEGAVHSIRNVMVGNGIRDEPREALQALSDRFRAEAEPLLLYIEIARQARGIDTSEALGAVELPAGKEWPFTMKLIEVTACFADERYQRPPGQRFVRDIVLNFDERLVGAIQASAREDGRFALLDGQTRWLAMQIIGKHRCWAAIYEGMDLAAEARFFYRVNKHRKTVSPFYGFRARVLSGEEKAVAIQAAVEAAGLKIRPDTSGERGQVAAVAALETVYDTPSAVREDTLAPVLAVLGTTWKGLKKSTDSELLRGLGRFFAVYADSEIVPDHLEDQLQALGPQLVIARARDVGGSVASPSKRATGLSAARALVAIYNTGLARSSRLDPARLER